MATQLLKNERVHYIHDCENHRRVLTLVVRLNEEDDTIQVGWAINNPTRWVKAQVNRKIVLFNKVPGDQFSKKQGRTLALKRLAEEPLYEHLEDRTPFVAALQCMLASKLVCDRAKRVITNYIEAMEVVEKIVEVHVM